MLQDLVREAARADLVLEDGDLFDQGWVSSLAFLELIQNVLKLLSHLGVLIEKVLVVLSELLVFNNYITDLAVLQDNLLSVELRLDLSISLTQVHEEFLIRCDSLLRQLQQVLLAFHVLFQVFYLFLEDLCDIILFVLRVGYDLLLHEKLSLQSVTLLPQLLDSRLPHLVLLVHLRHRILHLGIELFVTFQQALDDLLVDLQCRR